LLRPGTVALPGLRHRCSVLFLDLCGQTHFCFQLSALPSCGCWRQLKSADGQTKRNRIPPIVNEDSGLNGNGTVLAAQPDMAAFVADTDWDLEREKNLVAATSERVKRTVDPKLYQVFDLYILQDWRIEKIRKFLKVSSAKVYMAKYRISSMLKKPAAGASGRRHWNGGMSSANRRARPFAWSGR